MTDDIKLPPLHYDELPESGDAIPAMHNYARRAIKADRQQRGEPGEPEGWKLVPVEPTKEMLDVITSGIRHDHMVSVYQAMLAAAPKFGE